ncbi:MAG: spiro-SPASM protein [Treponema sp.]|jgi:spiro-SPASM protein|nr:spiro-SPASM protein [Treponema sp.]
MNVLTVLFGGNLSGEAFKPVFGGKSAFSLALERASAFPGTKKLILLGKEGAEYPPGGPACSVIVRDWTVSLLLKTLSEESEGFDVTCYAWADTPFLDGELAGKLTERHCRFAADYSYADGWPYGLAPELLGPGTAGILYKIAGEPGSGAGTPADGPVGRDSLFAVLQKDINSFDIETEISAVDLRCHRLNLAADSRRNLLLLERFASAGVLEAASASAAVEALVAEKPEYLRTLPNFFSVQVSAACPETPASRAGSCAFCPYAEKGRQARRDSGGGRDGFMAPERFAELLDKIEAFAGDGVIDISPWGEPALHPESEALVEAVLKRPALSLIVETAGIGWKSGAPARIAEKLKESAGIRDSTDIQAVPPRKNGMAALSWIVSLNENDLPAPEDPAQNAGLSPDAAGGAESEAAAFVRELVVHFPPASGEDRVYVQAVRTKGAEDAIERFYRAWKKTGAGIIIQKYNDFCGALPKRNAVDLSPVKRRPCWHIMRDFVVLLDGGVPFCANACPELWKGDGDVLLGNVFTGSLEDIWKRGEERYREHCREEYRGICPDCDEYYTYNF